MNQKKTVSRMISQMSKSSLKSGRLRNIFVMVTIFLSVSLLTVILLYGAASGEETKQKLKSSPHAAYFELELEQMEKLREDNRISCHLEIKSGISTQKDGCSVTPLFVSELSDKIMAGELEKGKLPKAKNQAAVEASFLKRIGVSPELGSTFSFTFFDGSTEEFEVTGILKGSEANKNHSMLLSREYAESGSQLSDQKYAIYAKLDKAEQMGKEECSDLIYQIGTEAGVEYKNINPTKAFLDSLSTDPQMVLLGTIVGAVILLACILVIYGVFYISVIGRIHQFGQLRTIGMTRKQVKKLVRKEGSRLFLWSFPFGILAGGIAGYFIKPAGFRFRNTILIFIIVIAINYIITMISVMKPAKLASKITPMEALHYNAQAESFPKKRAKDKDDRKSDSGITKCRELTPAGLGIMNFSRNKKKTVITMMSLGFGGILFLTAAVYMTSFNRDLYSRQLEFQYGEFNVYIPLSAIELNEHGLSGIQSDSPLSDSLRSAIENIPGVNKVTAVKKFGVKFDFEKEKEYGTDDTIVPLPEEEIKNLDDYMEEGTLDTDKLMSGDYVLLRGNNVVEEIYGWKFSVGDKVVFHYWNGSKMEEREAEILGFLESGCKSIQDGWFFLPEAVVKEWVPYENFDGKWVIATEAGKEEAVGKELKKLMAAEPELELETLADRREADQESISQLFGAVAGLSVFIMMFSILSMMNTLITNIVARKQELAMLESIGMTKRQRRNMILGECFSLAGTNILITLLLGTGAGYALCRLMANNGISYMAFRFPVGFAAAYVLVLVIVPMVITITAMHGFSKEALMERLHGMEC